MYERMLDKQCIPTREEMLSFCGEGRLLFNEINDFVTEFFGAQQYIKFPYGKRYGWCVAHYVNKKLICNVFPERDAVTVMFRLTDRQFAAVYGDVMEETQRRIDGRYPCGDGGWLHDRVASEAELQDLKLMLQQKTFTKKG